MSALSDLQKEIKSAADKPKAAILQRFFKTGPGDYGEGDIFLGISVPRQRVIAKKYADKIDFFGIQKLLDSKIHESRLIALMILVFKYEDNKEASSREKIVKFYLKNTKNINNWDLVDLSVYKILGDWLFINQAKIKILDKLAVSKNLWERRIAMIATYAFIKKGKTKDAFRIAEKLLADSHDLIHKAVGWMLREIGKRVSEPALLKFLNSNQGKMSRTTLRYAIERLHREQREYYLKR
ncbi:MAG: DNA alkylation repair protein [Patescibacteria group bacterium]